MGVVLKHTFKNIWSKKIRTLMLLFCIIVASFVAALSFDMTNSLQNILRSAFGSMFGNGNVIISNNAGIDDDSLLGTEGYEYDITKVAVRHSNVYKRDDEMYAYYNEKTLMTYGADPECINTMKLLATTIDLKDDECIISKKYAEDFGLKAGDTITIYGDNSVPSDFKVKEILPYYGLLDKGYCAVVTEEGIKSLSYDGQIHFNMAFVKVHDESAVTDFCRILAENMPTAQIENLVSGRMMTEQVDQISAVFYFMFAICLLLVVFVTISLSERIMVERMSTIGTLRSLGVSVKMTTMIILLENALYGLIGGAIGTGIYALIRDGLFNSIFTLNSGSDVALEMNLGNISPIAMIGVVVGTIIIECLCPIKELLRSVKTPIRDIIFDNKDTEFKYSKKTLIAAVLFALIGIPFVVLGKTSMSENLPVLVVGVLCMIIALFLGYPHLLRAVCKRAAKHFERKNKPVAQLACVQASTKKASVGNSRLCVMAVTICLMYLSLVLSYVKLVNFREADCDVFVNGLTEDSTRYSFIADLDGVTDVELMYLQYSSNMVFGSERIDEYMASDRAKKQPEFLFDQYEVIGADTSYKMCKMVEDMPETVSGNDIYLTKKLAKKYDLKVGDEVEILFKPTSVIPVRETFTVKGFINATNLNMNNTAILMSEDMYKKIYFDTPYFAFIRCSDPEAVIEQINKYASSMIDTAQTSDQRLQEMQEGNAGLTTLMYLMIIMGVGLTLVAVFSNQTVGFEGRKRESAVLISTAMSRGKLAKSFFIENILSALVAILVGAILAVSLQSNMFQMLSTMGMEFPREYNFPVIGVFAAAMFVVFTGTVINPLRHLRKMKTAEQLKYE
ncbi:MAG: FtsX-like permease family protein [Clostridiales bacterium]|nr:FtsX-like permease family protein [Clostridiales bacterium]